MGKPFRSPASREAKPVSKPEFLDWFPALNGEGFFVLKEWWTLKMNLEHSREDLTMTSWTALPA